MNDHPQSKDDRVERAVQALAQTPVPDGPPPEVLQTVLSAGGATGEPRAASKDVHPRARRHIMRRPIIRVAAVLAVAIGIAAVVLVTIDRSPTVAFAQVRRIVEQVQTMTCRSHMTLTIEGKQIESDMQASYKLPYLWRHETIIPGADGGMESVTIYDFEKGKVLNLVPRQKMAMLLNIGQLSKEIFEERAKNENLAEKMKELVQGDNEPLGEKLIDGRPAAGFRVTRDQLTVDLWVDADDGKPLVMEMDMGPQGMLPQGHMVISDIILNPPLDMSLFSLEIPEGYKAMPEMDMSADNISEDDLVNGLRFLAESNGNVFPPAPSLSPEVFKNLGKEFPRPANRSDEAVAEWSGKLLEVFMKRVGRMQWFIARHAETFKYIGNEVRLGDSQTPVCWYKPKDSPTYRIVYGALNVGDIAEEDLPKIENKPVERPEPEQPPSPTGGESPEP